MKKLILLLLSIFMLLGVASCSDEQVYQEEEIFEELSDLNGKKIGVTVGSICDEYVGKRLPNSEILYFNNTSDMIASILENKIDGMAVDRPQAIEICKDNKDELTYFEEPVGTLDYAYAFTKSERGQKLCEEVSTYTQTISENGELDRLNEKWLVNTIYENIDYQELENINGEIKVAIDTTGIPFSFMYNNEITGFDVEFLKGFAKAYGYGLVFEQYDFAGAIAATATGKVDISASGLMITEERKKNLYFSSPYSAGDVCIVYNRNKAASDFNNLTDLIGATFGCIEGGVSGLIIEKTIKDSNVLYLTSTTDQFINLTQGKVDAISLSSPIYESLKEGFPQARSIASLSDEEYGFGLYKNGNQKLKQDLNEYIVKCSEDNTLDTLYKKWLANDTSQQTIDKDIPDISNGTIAIGIASQTGKPHCFYQNGDDLVGFEVEFLYKFAKEYHYNLQFYDYSFAGLLTAVSTGKIDIATAGITITEERKKSIDFSEPYYYGYIAVITNSTKNDVVEEGLIDSLKESFNRTFIVEDRYKLFIDGIIKTVNITLFSIILGTIIGFALFIIFRLNNKVMNALLRFYSWLVTGMPTIVLLMILFYIVFAKVSINGTLVAIIAFTIIFSVTILGLLKVCFASIGKGQYEAAYALGYNKVQTFFKIIIPQVAPIFLPSYKGEIVSLIKSSSVVGYIAVQDLTKISDIVRSRTYDAFFPLIATTIIYFVIAALFKSVINLIQKKIDPKSRKKSSILSGVKTND